MRALDLKVPPAIVCLILGVAMWMGARTTPRLTLGLPAPHQLAAVLILAASVVVTLGVAGLRRAHTTLNPTQPDKAAILVQTGIYRWTRNPMYLGLVLLMAGWALLLDNALALVGVPILIIFLTSFQIVPEERALARRFGAEYRIYRSRVRRWL